MVDKIPLKTAILSANTGLDAIKRAPIVDYDTGRKCLRIQDVSQEKIFHDWGFTDVTDGNYEKFRLKEEDILIARTGASIGVSRYIPFDLESVYNNGLIRIRVDKKTFDPKYIYYLLQSQDFKDHIYAIAFATAAQPNMKIRDFLRFEIPYLPLQQQSYAASFLSNLDNKIALNRQINTTLESMAQALFKSWFVDFDPVIDNALAAGNEIPDELAARAARREALRQQTNKTANETSNKTTEATDAVSPEQALPETGLSDQRLPSEIQQIFPDRFVLTEEMGWVPEGWEVKPLSQFGQIVCGKTPSKSKPEFFGSDIPFIKIPDMHDNVFVVDPNEKLSNQGANSQVKKMLPRGSVCVSCIATVGKVVITVEPSQTNQQINSIIPHSGFVTEYLYFYMQTLEKHFHDLASGGSATLNMNTTTFGKVEIISPDSKVLDFFHRFVERSFSQIELRLKQSLTLTQLRDSLLPKLLSGQITIPDAEQQLAEVL